MKIEVLMSTMFFESEKSDYLENMNLETDIIIGNQTDSLSEEMFVHKKHKVKILSRSDRGVGLNRNVSLFSSDADVVVFADNDVVYKKGYAKIIEDYYNKNKKADVVIFNFKERRGEESLKDINVKNGKASFRDLSKFGTYAITARRMSLLRNRLSFSLLFGGGAMYSHGEDTIFLYDCYRKGLNIYLSSETIGEVTHRESTWYQGVTEKSIVDQGVLYKTLFPKWYKLAILCHLYRHYDMYRNMGSFSHIYSIMNKA